MKHFSSLLGTIALFALFLFPNAARSQCNSTGSGQFNAGTLIPTASWQIEQGAFGGPIYAGDFYEFAATAGVTYEFSTCAAQGATATFDTELTITTTAGAPIVYNDDGCGSGTASFISWTAPTSGTYRIYITEYICMANSGSATMAYRSTGGGGGGGPAGCLTALYGEYIPNFTPTCNGTPQILATDAWASEYHTVNLTAGNSYTFGSSVSTDFITISDGAGTIVLASGTTPVSYTPVTTGVHRFYTHTNSSCGASQVSRTSTITCSPAQANGIDGEMNTVNFPSVYTRVPTSQLQPLTFTGGVIRNAGNQSITSTFNVLIRNATNLTTAHTAAAAPATIAVGASSPALTATPTWTPPATPQGYLIDYIASTPNDIDPSNDTLNWAILVTDSVYARDANTNDFPLNIGQAGEAGLVYQVFNPTALRSVSLFVQNTGTTSVPTPSNVTITVNLRSFSTTPGAVLASANFTIPAGQTAGWITVPFPANPSLAAGNYMITMNDPSGNIVWGNSDFIFSPNIAWVNFTGTWQTFESINPATFSVAPMMRMNVGTPCPTLTASFSTTPASCGASTGGAVATVGGASGSATYVWDNGQTGTTLTNVAPGPYVLTVTETGNCVSTFNVTVPGTPAVTLPAPAVTAPLCAGDSATLVAAATGGTAPFTYNWTGGGSTFTGSSITVPAGTYNVSVTDSAGCTAQANNIQVTAPAAITASIGTPTQPACGLTNGGATASATGGTGTLTYLWDNGQQGPTLSNVGAGPYVVTVTDANNCTATASVTLSNPNSPTFGAPQVTNAACFGGNGTITVSATGGTGQLTYNWGHGPTGTSVTVPAGPYTVTVTDQNNCTASSGTITVTEPPALAGAVNAGDAGCVGGASASATISGGTPTYTYLWSNGNTGATASGLAAGPHSVVVTDANQCTLNVAFTVNTAPALVLNNVQENNAACNGGNGSAYLNFSGGTAPFTYAWSNNTSTDTLVAGAGSYSVTLTDATQCTLTASVVITEPAAITAITTPTDASCGQTDGQVVIAPSGGTGSYTVTWTPGNATGTTLSNVGVGTYTANVVDANQCSATFTATVGNPNAPVAAPQVSNAPCLGDDGTIALNVTGGTAPYTVAWTPTGSGENATLPAGTYSAVITDANQCQTAVGPFTITQPDSALQVQVVTTDESGAGAADGSATANPSGGTAPYTYSWNHGPTTQTANNLTAGQYTVIVTDANNCTTNETITISSGMGIDNAKAARFSLYPNPSTDQEVYIRQPEGIASFTADVYDASGRLLRSLTSRGETLLPVDARSLPAGMYIITVRFDGGSESLRFVRN